jgi:hypothetical protein
MAESKASRRKIAAAERRVKALELRKAGKTYREIGRALGYSEQRAHKLVTAELSRLNAQRVEQAKEVTRLELERLDALWAGVWTQAKRGNGAAVDRALSIMQRRARLLGLDAPKQSQVEAKVNQTVDLLGEVEQYAEVLRSAAGRVPPAGPPAADGVEQPVDSPAADSQAG